MRWQGHIDLPLNSAGRAQAEALSVQLAGAAIEVILSSDLARARETAEILARPHGAVIHLSDRLREVHVGQVEGLQRDAVIERFGEEALAAWRDLDNREFAFPGGESKHQALSRGLPAIEGFLQWTPARTVAIVFHSLLMRLVLYSLFPELKQPLGISNCRYFELAYDSETRTWYPEGELRELLEAMTNQAAAGA
jgi:broad specificity phosphatase PhoE